MSLLENSIIDSSPVKWNKREGLIPYEWKDDHDTKITMWIPKPPEDSEILGYNLKKKDQKWENIKPELPTIKGKHIESFSGIEYEREREYKWQVAEREEMIKQRGEDPLNKKRVFPEGFANPYYFNPVLERFRKQEWERRKNGVWVFIKGKKVYLPPSFYFFVAWIKIDFGSPLFMFPIIDYAMILEWLWGHPVHLGALGMGGRGWAKTSFGMAFALEKITRNPSNQRMAIQSKNDKDGKDLFVDVFRFMFHSMPSFFKPYYDPNDGDTLRIKKVLGRSSMAAMERIYNEDESEEGLNNQMKYFASGELVLDGKNLQYIFNDEFAKLEKGSCFERNSVNKKAVFRPILGKIGMINAVSTAEKMSRKGSVEAKKLFDSSQLNQDDPNKPTPSGLVRFIFYADRTYMMHRDDYGFVDRIKTSRLIKEEHSVAGKKSKSNMLAEMRKMPLEFSHMWIKENANNNFDINLLNNRIKELDMSPNSTHRRVKFRSGKDGKVVWVADPQGPWYVTNLDPIGGANHFTQRGVIKNTMGQRVPRLLPLNTTFFKAGADPVDDSIKGLADKGKMSMPALLIHQPFNPLVDREDEVFTEEDCPDILSQYKLNRFKYKTHVPVALFFHRYDDPNDNYEQMALGIKYYGCQVHIEKNKHGFINYLSLCGMQDFIMRKPRMLRAIEKRNKDEYTATSTALKPTMIEIVLQYIELYGHLIPFQVVCEQLRDFDVEDFREYDIFIALAYALIACFDVDKTPTSENAIDLGAFMGSGKGKAPNRDNWGIF